MNSWTKTLVASLSALACAHASQYLPLANAEIQSLQTTIQVLDVVTKEPIEGVEIGFYFSDQCHQEDIFYMDYDYTTCEGRYEPLKNQISDKKGIVPIVLNSNNLQPTQLRYYIVNSPGYIRTRSYGVGYHSTVWLVPNNAPLPSKKAAIDYLATQQPIQQIVEFYKNHGMEPEYLYEEKEAWYGVWRVTLNVFRPTISNGQNPEIIPDQLSMHNGVTILVHPGTSEYVICNSYGNRKSMSIPLLGLEENEESKLFNSLDNTYTYQHGTEECSPELLLGSN